MNDADIEVRLLVKQHHRLRENGIKAPLSFIAPKGSTENTVKSNINRILSKIGAKDRTQATIIALKRGLTKS
jgi:hypothetical protein